VRRRTWKLTIEYDGTRYSGWQQQKNARTVAGEILAAAEELLETEIELGGAGRTDAGVHAAEQVAHLREASARRIQAAELVRGLNERLPADIAVLSAEPAHSRFHARHSAVSRSYVYQIATRKMAFSKRYVWWIKEPLDLSRMSEAARRLIGRHDFRAFAASDDTKERESTIVELEAATVERDGDLILIRLEASHFLWRMVRRIVGVLVKLGKNEITEADFVSILEGSPNRGMDVAAWTAPASGLFLDSVRYPDD
jgi:tRNA pseudouridine38-40 synthase